MEDTDEVELSWPISFEPFVEGDWVSEMDHVQRAELHSVLTSPAPEDDSLTPLEMSVPGLTYSHPTSEGSTPPGTTTPKSILECHLDQEKIPSSLSEKSLRPEIIPSAPASAVTAFSSPRQDLDSSSHDVLGSVTSITLFDAGSSLSVSDNPDSPSTTWARRRINAWIDNVQDTQSLSSSSNFSHGSPDDSKLDFQSFVSNNRIAPSSSHVLHHRGTEYTILGVLGRGSYGCVVLARTSDGDQVAIKIFTKGDYDPEFRLESILSERDTLLEISSQDNPFLTPLLASFQDTDNIYFVMVSLKYYFVAGMTPNLIFSSALLPSYCLSIYV